MATTPIKKIFDFHYDASFDNGLIEHEFDHVYVGTYTGNIKPNPTEVQDYCYKKIEEAILQLGEACYGTIVHVMCMI